MSLAIEFLAATHPKEERETLWTWCQCYGFQVYYVLQYQDETKKIYACPDCGLTIEKRTE